MTSVVSPSASTPSTLPTPAPAGEKLSAAAKQFEAIFVRQMLSEARKASFGDDLMGSSAQDTFREMQDSKFADLAADKGVFGLAAAIERQLAGRVASASTSSARADSGAGAGSSSSSASGLGLGLASGLGLGSGSVSETSPAQPEPVEGRARSSEGAD